MKPAGGRAANDKFVALTILCGEALFPGEQKTEKDTGAEEIINRRKKATLFRSRRQGILDLRRSRQHALFQPAGRVEKKRDFRGISHAHRHRDCVSRRSVALALSLSLWLPDQAHAHAAHSGSSGPSRYQEMAQDLFKAGAMDEITMRNIDALCLPRKRPFRP